VHEHHGRALARLVERDLEVAHPHAPLDRVPAGHKATTTLYAPAGGLTLARGLAYRRRALTDPVSVGVIANPASGRDIRRLVSAASVFDNAEKGNMVHRVMAGLGATGVERILMMPAGAGVGETLQRRLTGGSAHGTDQPMPALELVEMRMTDSAADTAEAVRRMVAEGVRAIVVLGGDGTHRMVAKHCGDTPLCALSTGTNNAFPEMREATVAGMATGLVAGGRVDGRALRRHKVLRVEGNGGAVRDEALVDVAVSTRRWVGARALWRPEDTTELFVTFATPGSVGLSAIAGLLEPTPRSAAHGLHIRLCDSATAAHVITVPVAPGLLAPVGVESVRRLGPHESVDLERAVGSLALDGEREVEFGADDALCVRLDPSGPVTIDVESVMGQAAREGMLRRGPGVPAPPP
jgi:predicted polyphosphate/ATP-dependent NAD kinase